MKSTAIIVARLIFAFVFAMAASIKFADMAGTAQQIASVGWPAPMLFAWLAALLEVALAVAFLTGLYFTEAALVAIPYILLLAFLFHGPNRFAANPMEFGFFVDHFVFVAGLLFAAVHGPGDRLVLRRRG